jgi:hypothetical protein
VMGHEAQVSTRLGKNTFGIDKVSILDGISQVSQESICINTKSILIP